MLLLGFEVPLWALLTTILAILFYWSYTSTYSVFKEMQVPHQTPLPLIGNALRLFKESLVDGDLRNFHRFGKIWGTYDGRVPNLIIADAEMIKQIGIKDFTSFTNRRKFFIPSKLLSRSLTIVDDDHWKHLRNSMTPTFTSGKLKQMVATINDCGDRFAEHLKSTGSSSIKIKEYTSGFTMDVIASTAFGIEIDSQKDTNHPFLEHAGAFFGSTSSQSPWKKFTLALRVFVIFVFPKWIVSVLDKLGFALVPAESQEYFTSVVQKVLENRIDDDDDQKRTDFLQICVKKMISLDKVSKESLKTSNGMLWSTEGMTHDEIMSNATLFIVAGYETTATTLQFFFYQMAKSPEIQQKLYEHIMEHSKGDNATHDEITEMDYLDQCVHEVMRIYPPAPRFDREAGRDTEVSGYKIPKGMIVSAAVYAIHHNAEYWPEPEVFKPERFAPENREEHHQYTWLPFGIGNRSCIAMRLALLEVKLGIVKIMKDFHLQRTAGTPEKFAFKKGTGFPVPLVPLELKAVPRE